MSVRAGTVQACTTRRSSSAGQRRPPNAISLEALALLTQKADGGPGSFTAAMDAGRAHVETLIDQMRTDIARQRDLDDTAAGLAGRA